MNKEIKELEDKYLVLKWDDINEILDGQDLIMLNHFLNQIKLFRKHQGKKDNRYVVLNLDDEIDLRDLIDRIKKRLKVAEITENNVSDIAIDLVNAILKTKE